MANNTLTYSASPHVKKSTSTRAIMIEVCIALLPACIMGVVYFGLTALLILALSVLSAVLSEYVFLLTTGKKTKQIIKEFDFTSCVTGLLIGMCIGVNYPLYAPVFGSMFAIIVVKMLFGGTGKNLVNPAITGRIFIFMSFQAVVGPWILPGGEVNTGATVLPDTLNGLLPSISNWDLFLGVGVAGCIGETCKLALILGGIYLAIRGIINIGYPILYITMTGLTTVALQQFNFDLFLPSILSGGLMLGAIFMATDYTTTPNTTKGNILYFTLLGIVTALLRVATQMEVVSFAILLMNLFVPLIDKFMINRPFGYQKQPKGGNK